ncbi:MAG TPA: DAK2 domain-containing protein [Acidimicrobiales bacterium]|nr:DAK2 domain-containing protein [Acidimicrobiales bacterium]
MQTLERLDAPGIAAVMTAYRDALREHQERINRLNVFPVPDGDTGTNMALTLQSVVEGLPVGPEADLAAVARAISHGSLMGARGNSGVILSQILRGLAEAVRDSLAVDGRTLADGLGRAAAGAYKAVQEPVEGTILSVVRAAAESVAAESAAGSDAGLLEVAERARSAAADALARTPEQLEALRAAGVVDSGGSGLLLLLDALLHVLDGRPLPACEAGPGALPDAGGVAAATADEGTASCRYEVMYLLDAPDEAVPAFREVWSGLGDSIVVVGGDGTWNCHIHTDDIGAAIEAALDAGRPSRIRVTDLFEEIEEERWVREAAGAAGTVEEPHAHCAVVAVCTGDGIRRIFASLGVHRFVTGGQSMNPSTADLLAAIEDANADEVVLLPNNKNVVAVAEAAAAAASKPARVVVTHGIQEGIAALLDYDPEGSADDNVVAMAASAAHVVGGEVTRAVRDSTSPAGPIAEGDYLGISRDGIRVVAPSVAEAATGLLEALIDVDHHEVVTIIAGEAAHAADTRRITEWIEERHPQLVAEVHPGGQPLYPYLLSVE